ncbi:alanine racemase [Streptomyces sp. Termitarium-T10T-6]|nr:alanine racemase [Streptomyces sp. Termitarium-T10T-6]
MTLAAAVALVKDAPAGHGVSYGHHYTTPADTTLGLIPVGYADGVPRHASGSGPVLVDGKVRTVAGRVAMDQFVVDLEGDRPEAGAEAVLFGPATGASRPRRTGRRPPAPSRTRSSPASAPGCPACT